MIGVIDYKAGNAPSVMNALQKIGISSRLITCPEEIKNLKGIILPGVGYAKTTIDSLLELNYIETLERKVLHEGIPFLGICIGLQILFEHSEEGDTDCLGWIKGNVKKFPKEKLRVPQIGWNKVNFTKDNPILEGLSNSEYFYFVNSYYVSPKDDNVILAKTEYGIDFCSMITYKNIFATQFHVEKSGAIGLKLLKNFALLAGGSIC